ncbi:hypothetical protein [Spirosoma litoris]
MPLQAVQESNLHTPVLAGALPAGADCLDSFVAFLMATKCMMRAELTATNRALKLFNSG